MTRAAMGDPFFDKGLPSNVEAERSILGAILLDNAVCNQAIELLRRDDFFLDSHRRIFDKMVVLTERLMPIDLITLSDELRRAGEFEQIGGATYIASLIDGVPRTDTIEPYAKLVKQKSMLRKLISASPRTCFSSSPIGEAMKRPKQWPTCSTCRSRSMLSMNSMPPPFRPA